MLFWNKLPIEVKNASTSNPSKANLKLFKKKLSEALGIYGNGDGGYTGLATGNQSLIALLVYLQNEIL